MLTAAPLGFACLPFSFLRLQELDLLEDEAPVFKLIGPVLMKQDLEEAKQNVVKRLELIEREM